MLFCSPVEWKKIVRSLHDQRKASATMTLRSYDATYDVFKGYDLLEMLVITPQV